jgi:hypothetical protein
MLNQLQDADIPSNEALIRQARDALIHVELIPERSARVELRGVITRVRNHGGLIFYIFEDATATLQLLARRDRFGPDDWVQMRRVKPSARVIAKGMMSKSLSGEPTVVLDDLLRPLDSTETSGAARTIRSLDRVGVRLFLARLRYKAEAFFRSRGFLQIEPNFISTTWDIVGIEPLRVEYEGFGAPTYLTPSPSPQLLAAMEATGSDKAFAVGRCFTTTYRDETTSAESLILMAKVARATINDLADLSQEALSATLGDRETMPENYLQLTKDGWRSVLLEEPPLPGRLALSAPIIRIYELPSEGPDTPNGTISGVAILQACWPPRHVLAEGSVRKLSGQTGIGTITLFLERMVPLLKDVPLRQIRDLQKAGD